MDWYNKQDWRVRFIILISLFAIGFTWVVTSQIGTINRLDVPIQFLMVTVTLLLVGSYVVGMGMRAGVRATLGTISVMLATDLLLPPYIVSMNGVLAQVDMSGATIAALLQWAYTAIHIPLSVMWFFVYPISFVLLMTIGVITLSQGQFRRSLR